MHLFSNITYQLSGQEIELLFYSGQATTVLGLLKYTDDFQKSQGLNQLWYKDTATAAAVDGTNNGFSVRHGYVIKSPDPKGTFSFRIPLKHIFVFAEDYDNIVHGFRHVLTLVQKSDDDAIFRLAAAGSGKITLSKVSWYIPHVRPTDVYKLRLYEMIEKKTKLTVGFRMRQCERISVPRTRNFSWRLIVKSGAARYSEGSLIRRFVIRKVRYSEDANFLYLEVR